MNIIKKLSIITILLATIFTGLIIATFCIPTSAVQKNVEQSAMQIQHDGVWYKPLGCFLFQIDNLTDCQMLRINATADSNRPVWAAMIAEQYDNTIDTINSYNNVVVCTKHIAHTGRTNSDIYSNYARYWHGYQVLLRPLLTLFSYHTILVINYVSLLFIILSVILATYRIVGNVFALTLTLSLALTNIFIVPFALQFSTCYYIFLLAMALFIIKPEYTRRKDLCIYIFFIIGAITSYMDFLTTPVLTLGMPLVTLIAINEKKNHSKQLPPSTNTRRHQQAPIKTIIYNSMAWGAGYAILWILKWCIGSLLTKTNIFDSAMHNAKLRVGNTLIFNGKEIPLSDFIHLILNKVYAIINPWLIILIFVAIIVLVALYVYKHWEQTKQHYWILIIAMMPVAWFIVMKNHSIQHIFFTWRDFLLTVWCLTAYLCLTIRKPKAI